MRTAKAAVQQLSLTKAMCQSHKEWRGDQGRAGAIGLHHQARMIPTRTPTTSSQRSLHPMKAIHSLPNMRTTSLTTATKHETSRSSRRGTQDKDRRDYSPRRPCSCARAPARGSPRSRGPRPRATSAFASPRRTGSASPSPAGPACASVAASTALSCRPWYFLSGFFVVS